MSEDVTELLKTLERKVDHLTYLVRTGGKESRVMEHAPLWTPGDCDAECEVTGTPVPKSRLVKFGGYSVHPGAVEYAKANNIEDFEEAGDVEVPEDYLATPYVVRFRERYKPPTLLDWDPKEIPNITRPGLMYLCHHLGVSATLAEQGHPVSDFRSESSEWMREAIQAIVDGKDLPAPDRALNKGKKNVRVTKTEKAKEPEKPEGNSGKGAEEPAPPPKSKSDKPKGGSKQSSEKATRKSAAKKATAKKSPKKTAKKAPKNKPKTGKKKAAKKKAAKKKSAKKGRSK